MKKTYNREELEKKAQKTFDEFPDTQKVFATSDGNVFINKNYAELHAGEKGVVTTIERKAESKPAAKTDKGEGSEGNKNEGAVKPASKPAAKPDAKPAAKPAAKAAPKAETKKPEQSAQQAPKAAGDNNDNKQ